MYWCVNNYVYISHLIFCFVCGQNTPLAGHMAAALDNNRMLVFGGKGKKGHVYGDTWIYYRDANQWQLIQNNEVKRMCVLAFCSFVPFHIIVETCNDRHLQLHDL